MYVVCANMRKSELLKIIKETLLWYLYDAIAVNEPPPRGSPQSRNHADFFPFSRIHAINEKLGFSRKNVKNRRKTCLSRNYACFWMISRNHAHFSTFSRITQASRFTQSRRNKIVFTQSRRKIRPITQSRNPMGGGGFIKS